MELGEKIKQARLEAGLSQRQLCGDAVTRNMLSQIENGSARPSMDTLRYFAARLGKTLSYFLEEDAVLSPNQAVMARARDAYDGGKWEAVLEILKEFRQPDELFCRERDLLEALATLELARGALNQGKDLLARQLMEELKLGESGFCIRELRRRRSLILGQAAPEERARCCRELPGMDEELLLRAQDALERGDTLRSEQLLEAAEDKTAHRWNLLRGQTHLARGQFTKAAVCFLRVEDRYPAVCYPSLEACYRELGNYEKAYEYACKQKNKEKSL